MELPKSPLARNVLVAILALLFVWQIIELAADVLVSAEDKVTSPSPDRTTAKADPTLFAQIEEARRKAMELERAFNSVRDDSFSFKAIQAEKDFGGAEWRLREDAKAPGEINQKDALLTLRKYKDVVALRQEAIRDALCDQIVVFVGADGSAAKGVSVTSVVTRYPKRESVTSPLAAEYCDASSGETLSQVEVR